MKCILLLAFGGTLLFSHSAFAEEYPSGGTVVRGDRYITDDDLRADDDSLTTTVGNTVPVRVYNEYPVGSPERYHRGPNLGVDFWDDYRRPRFGGHNRDWERQDRFGGGYDDRHFGDYRGPDRRPFDGNHLFGGNHNFGGNHPFGRHER